MIADLFLKASTFVGGELLSAITKLPHTWIGDPWFWVLPSIFFFTWWRHRSPPVRLRPESEDSPTLKCSDITMPPVCQPLARPDIPPLALPTKDQADSFGYTEKRMVPRRLLRVRSMR